MEIQYLTLKDNVDTCIHIKLKYGLLTDKICSRVQSKRASKSLSLVVRNLTIEALWLN